MEERLDAKLDAKLAPIEEKLHAVSSFEWVSVDSRDQAINYFAKKYGLVVEEYDDGTQNVCFNSKDKSSMKYNVRVHEDEKYPRL